jgi:hypothetical protein
MFDLNCSQTCPIYFGSWAHPNTSISYRIYNPDEGLQLLDFYDNQEWTLVVGVRRPACPLAVQLTRLVQAAMSSVTIANWEYEYIGKRESWDAICLTVTVKRTSFYYVFNLVLPSTIIVVVAVIGFHSPSSTSLQRSSTNIH